MKEFTEEDYKKHIEREHSKVSVSSYLKEIVYGGSDGIVTTFAVVAGFTGAQSGVLSQTSIIVVLVFGFANLFADAFSMGAGNVLSILADKDVYKTERDKELYEIKNNKELEEMETLFILQKKGFTKNQAQKITYLYSKNEDYWAEFMMRYELEMPTPEHENPILTGAATFSSFIVFGFIPLAPYILLSQDNNKFLTSILFTLIALILLGGLRWKVTSQTILRAVGEIVILGGAAAAIAYFVGTLFK